MSDRIEVNKPVFILSPELVQNMASALTTLPYGQVHAILDVIKQLPAVPLKDFTIYEVKVAEKEVTQEAVKEAEVKEQKD